ncbi:hypothetical protein DPMN_038245 [Dreissena polymorpha]|uniref:Uncharacterized protein n=1 Tax=Dreissena polymorpha TaxID=45954 RepID=A0A9D4MCE0_DREPO|nr:hypothetical protein DPMN_038245 [Dreissena polymorpha]
MSKQEIVLSMSTHGGLFYEKPLTADNVGDYASKNPAPVPPNQAPVPETEDRVRTFQVISETATTEMFRDLIGVFHEAITCMQILVCDLLFSLPKY